MSSGAGPSNLSTWSNQREDSEEANLSKNLNALDTEIADIKQKIKDLERLAKELTSDRNKAAKLLDTVRQRRYGANANGKGKEKAIGGLLDYSQSFEWTLQLRDKLKSLFGINSFRLCQEAYAHSSHYSPSTNPYSHLLGYVMLIWMAEMSSV